MATASMKTYYSNIGNKLIACEGGSESIHLTDANIRVPCTYCRNCTIVAMHRVCQVFISLMFEGLRGEEGGFYG